MNDIISGSQSGFPSPERKNEVIERLKRAFTNGRLSLEEYESRIGSAEIAETSQELENLVSDLPKTLSEQMQENRKAVQETESIHTTMGTKKLSGTILSARSLTITASMSTITLDYNSITPPQGIQEIDIDLNMSTLILYVPDTVGIENRTHENMSNFIDRRKISAQDQEIETLIRLSGESRMSTIKIKKDRRWFFSRKKT